MRVPGGGSTCLCNSIIGIAQTHLQSPAERNDEQGRWCCGVLLFPKEVTVEEDDDDDVDVGGALVLRLFVAEMVVAETDDDADDDDDLMGWTMHCMRARGGSACSSSGAPVASKPNRPRRSSHLDASCSAGTLCGMEGDG